MSDHEQENNWKLGAAMSNKESQSEIGVEEMKDHDWGNDSRCINCGAYGDVAGVWGIATYEALTRKQCPSKQFPSPPVERTQDEPKRQHLFLPPRDRQGISLTPYCIVCGLKKEEHASYPAKLPADASPSEPQEQNAPNQMEQYHRACAEHAKEHPFGAAPEGTPLTDERVKRFASYRRGFQDATTPLEEGFDEWWNLSRPFPDSMTDGDVAREAWIAGSKMSPKAAPTAAGSEEPKPMPKCHHACPDWDYLVISENDPEFECCACYPRVAPVASQAPKPDCYCGGKCCEECGGCLDAGNHGISCSHNSSNVLAAKERASQAPAPKRLKPNIQDARNWIICATEHPDPARREEAVKLIAEGLAALSLVIDNVAEANHE